ncbi:MAG: hypothetical protein Q7T33_03560 [Dehalococcoidia bacterium]|nr:hypothetical protein [Dehalococcoidia bacterium]
MEKSWVEELFPLRHDAGEVMDFYAAVPLLIAGATLNMQHLQTREYVLQYEGFTMAMVAADWDGAPVLILRCAEGGNLRLPPTEANLQAGLQWLEDSGRAVLLARMQEAHEAADRTRVEEATILRDIVAAREQKGWSRQEALLEAVELFIDAYAPSEPPVQASVEE